MVDKLLVYTVGEWYRCLCLLYLVELSFQESGLIIRLV